MNETVQEWLRKANNDFANAKTLLNSKDEQSYDLICFLCQQSIEKLFKGLLIQQGQLIDKIHSLDKLADQLKQCCPNWNLDFEGLKWLSTIGIMSRYPEYDAAKEDVTEAFKLSSSIREQLLQYFI